jgi:hypothetical protein
VGYSPLFFAPDLETSWSMNPGACTLMDGLGPLANGNYGAVTPASYMNTTIGLDTLTAYCFRQVDGTVRVIAGRVSNLDEYTVPNTRTNRGTGYSASTADWSMAAWGNQIIACNYLDATQSSTGAGFSGLGGSSPKARHVAVNVNFAMLADVDDSASNVFSDMVWWSAIQDPASWTPSLATEAGNYRLLQAPGPIRALISFRDTFIAFKDNAIFVGEYVGPPFVFAWRLVSNRVGTPAAKSVVELDGKLYFFHSSGFWEFDGVSLRNVGLPVIQSFLTESNYATAFSTSYSAPSQVTYTSDAISKVQATADDLEGLVFWKGAYQRVSDGVYFLFVYVYNARSGKWGRYADRANTDTTGKSPCWLRGSTLDIQTFKATGPARAVMIYPDQSVSNYRAIQLPSDYGNNLQFVGAPSFTTGLIGDPGGSKRVVRVHLWSPTAYTSGIGSALTVTGYASPNATSNSSSTGVVNTEIGNVFDVNCDGRYHKCAVTVANSASSQNPIISALALEYAPQAKR